MCLDQITFTEYPRYIRLFDQDVIVYYTREPLSHNDNVDMTLANEIHQLVSMTELRQVW